MVEFEALVLAQHLLIDRCFPESCSRMSMDKQISDCSCEKQCKPTKQNN